MSPFPVSSCSETLVQATPASCLRSSPALPVAGWLEVSDQYCLLRTLTQQPGFLALGPLHSCCEDIGPGIRIGFGNLLGLPGAHLSAKPRAWGTLGRLCSVDTFLILSRVRLNRVRRQPSCGNSASLGATVSKA